MKTLPALAIMVVVFTLTGCAMWNKYDLRQVKVSAPPGSTSVAVACVDDRESLRQGDIVPELIGVTRDGFGIPYRVKTANKQSVALELATAITQGFGTDRKTAPPISSPDTTTALAALRGTGADRQVLVLIQNFNSETLVRTELDYAFTVEVRDADGNLLAIATRNETADLRGSFLLPAKHAHKSVLSKTGATLTQLLCSPEIQDALR